MFERLLPASPNWYCSRCSDVSSTGLLGVGAKSSIYLVDVTVDKCTVKGELVGHVDLVSGFSFCHHTSQTHLCVSSAHDGSVRFWDSNSRTLLKEHAVHQSPVSAVHWSPAEKNLVVSGDEKGVVVLHWFHSGETSSFFPEPRTIFCLSCSPHTWSCVAVGYKDGMIVLMDLSRKGEVTHRLRGHDDEIHSLAWSPQSGEGALYSRTEDTEGTNGESSSDHGCYLSSGSKDQTLRIWSSAKGKAVLTLKLPYLKRRGSAVDPAVKERLWLSVLWSKSRPGHLLSSCFSGELLLWDLSRSVKKQRWTVLGASPEAQNHSRIVFNMSSVLLQDTELLLSTSMDREMKCWDLSSLDCCWTLPSLGGFVYALAFSPVGGAGSLALGVGDSMIRVWNTLSSQNRYDTRTFWQGIRSKVTALAWHPRKEGWLAFGTDDGKVGIYDAFSNKPPQISSSYHRKTVYRLAWGPPLHPMASAAGKSCLYSCAGEGVVLQHDPTKLNADASDIDDLIRETNDIKHKLSPHSDLCWKPDGTVVAVGNEDGCIEVFAAPRLQQLCSIQQHHKIINCLRWHHGHAPAPPQHHALLASGSSNAIVYVHDLASVIENPPDHPAVLTEPYRKLCGHTSKITGLAWSPHHDARLVTASYDGTAQVWDVLQEDAIANYRGHTGYVLCADWSPVDPDLVWTGGKDFTVQEWSVVKQEFNKPPKGKKMVNLKERMKKNKKNKKTTTTSEVNGSASPDLEKGAATGQEVSGGEEEDAGVGSSSGAATPAVAASSETPRKCSSPLAAAAAVAAATKTRDRPDPALLQQQQQKKKKPRSLLPLSSSLDHRPKDQLLQDCVTLAALQNQNQNQDRQNHSDGDQDPDLVAPPAGCVPGQGDHLHLGLFSDRAALHRMFSAEEDAHMESGHMDSLVQLRLWSGDLKGALQLATERGELNDYLLSIAPMAGFEAWRGVVDAFVRQLCREQNFVKAASHLLTLNRVYEAAELLRAQGLYREAVALAKARLPGEDPLVQQLYSCWATSLEKDGHFSSAAKCYLAAGAGFDAAKVLSRKSDAASLRAAASVARLSGERVQARGLALRCSKELMGSQNWVSALDVLMEQQHHLLIHQLLLSVAELLAATLEDDDAAVASRSAVPHHHEWASTAGHAPLLERVMAVWAEQFGVSQQSQEHGGAAAALAQELRSVESPTASASSALSQVLMMSSLHFSSALLAWLQGDGGQLIAGLWRAVTSLTDAGSFAVSAAILRRLFPDGDVSICSRKRLQTCCRSDDDSAAADALHAIAAYHRLYERWWAGPGPSDDKNTNGEADAHSCANGDEVAPAVSDDITAEVADDPLWLLLSESHAALQANQRRAGELQRQLGVMVTQHQRGAEDSGKRENDDEDNDDDNDEQETFLSLSLKMTQIREKLDGESDDVKTFARPDVVECCLVLLHVDKSSVSESLRRRATELLRKYATTPALLNASRKFLES